MTLATGARLGPYDIVALLGVGGMGEVYRATDTNLKRAVAIKVLPASVATDPERLARFQREAEVLAALNHPHIAAIYGLEKADGVTALVLELVEGPTLADRIAQGSIPIDEALPIAKQIAEALEAAHEQGIIHRDLKPANIKVRPDGAVKVLDFGLAKALEPTGTGSTPASLANSPTITSPAMMTGVGVILGTAAYMSPEQAKGRPADKRSDIWAFGCVLYEMLTGMRPFDGEDVSDTLANVLKIEPDWSALPSEIPPAIRTLLQSCLTKDRRRRVADISTALFVLEKAASLSAPAGTAFVAPLPRKPLWRRVVTPVAAALVTSTAVGAGIWFAMRPIPPRVSRLMITTPPAAAPSIGSSWMGLAITPNATRVIYVGNNGTQLFGRALATLEPVAMASGAPRGPFVSPDGMSVGFTDDATMKRVAITGGPPMTIAQTDGNAPAGATWAPDDTIIFATNNPTTGLQSVSAHGGTPTVLTTPDRARGEYDHIWPEILPGGRAVLFTITAQTGGLDAAQIAVRDLQSGTQRILVRGGSDARYVASGHLVYTTAGTLRAVAFDLDRLEAGETTVPVVPGLVTTNTGAGEFAVAADGTLVYLDAPAGRVAGARTLVWVDRQGREEPLLAPPRAYAYPQLSPDGTRIALDIRDQEQDLWIWDLRRGGALTRLTVEPGLDVNPVWTPNGERIIFSSDRAGGERAVPNLWWQAADGNGEAERLTTSSNAQFATGIAPDGTVVLNEYAPTGRDLLQFALRGTRGVMPLVQTRFEERNGVVSPDGHWLAYASERSGRLEIWVQSFPEAGGQSQISTLGGTAPQWARNGKELFYMGLDGALMGAGIEASRGSWKAGTPTKLLEPRYFFPGFAGAGRSYDVSLDGQRFLMINRPGADATAGPPNIVVMQYWSEELKAKVPTK